MRIQMPKKQKEQEANQYPVFLEKEPKGLIVIPNFPDISKVDVTYPLIEPFAYAKISWDPNGKKLVYRVVEPALEGDDLGTMKKIEEALMEIIDVKMSVLKNREEAIQYLQTKIQKVLNDMNMAVSSERYTKITYYLVRNFVGLNEIEPMMFDPYIEDIGCTGMDTPVYIIHKKFGSLETNLVYRDADILSNFVIKISERCGRYISYATPLLDGRLPDGSRVQASFAKDVTTKGPTFSIRKFRKNPFSPIDMIEMKTASEDMMAYLWILIQHNVSILVTGGVSTGKTSFLNSLSMFIPREEKIVSIEDTREINLPHENWIPAVSREGFGIPEMTGKRYGEVDLFDLLKESFRQNPDYVVVGEVRGKEAYVMFQGMASGHASLGPMHAGSLEDVMKRLQTPPIELSPSLIESLDAMIVMTNAKEKGKSARRVKEIDEIQSIDSHTGIAHSKKIFTWIPSEDSYQDAVQESVLLQKISFAEGVQLSKVLSELKDRKSVLSWMHRNSIKDFEHVCDVINLYYKDKPTVMSWVKKGENPFSKGITVLPKEIKPAKEKKKPPKKQTARRESEELKEIKQILA
ncbi:MAG: type II/IV secretion system ATPase subunit, partial [Candidatus Aenigmarchaeota archaeon]|nr:type II/IV secretion system ATPase subunit [Candidatus Aenigmarchaeota archaeon]